MNPSPLATPYMMEALFFEELLPLEPELLLLELPLDFAVVFEEAEEAVLLPAPELPVDVPLLEEILPLEVDFPLLEDLAVPTEELLVLDEDLAPLEAAFVLLVDVDAVPALACVVPDFRIYDGISTVLRDVVLIFCAVSVTSRA